MASFLCNFFYFFFFTLLCLSNAYTFNVGGKDGWTLHPKESYNQWSGRLRFIVNDILHFKYESGSDSVMEVSKGDYDSCNTNSPITTLTGGDSSFNLNRPGPFYFISGNKSNCDQGQKLTVVVISPKTKKSPPATAPTPSKSFSPTTPVSPVSSPPGSGTPVSTSPAGSPTGGVSSSPTGNPADSPSGGGSSSPAGGPASSMGGGGSSSPAGGPASSPGGGMSSSPAGGPAASPGGGISSSPTGNPAGSPGGGPAGSPSGNPADVNAPAPKGSQAWAARPAVSASLSVIIFVVGWVC